MPPQKPQTREEFVKSLFLMDERDNLHKDARKKLAKGISKIADALKVSYGSAGSNSIIEEDMYPYHRVSNDGKRIAQAIRLADPIENMGANIAKETADKSDQISGDGRKTSVILLDAIVQEGMKSDATPMEIKRSLTECLPIILDSIDGQTREITVDDVPTIAQIAGESEELGRLYGEIYSEIGKDGVVELDNSNLPETFYEIIDGVRLLGCGFQYPYMAPDGKRVTYKDPYVLITRQKIANISQLNPILEAITKEGKNELVIFCDDIDVSVSQALGYIHMQGVEKDGGHLIFKTLVIKAPTLWKDWLFDDFAKITGATVIDPTQGTTLKSFRQSYFGTCEKLISTKAETIVLGTKDISAHVQSLEQENTEDAKLRISRLKTKTAILKLGANTESELSHLQGKALDARNASYLALNGGVVKGGGVALHTASELLPDTVGGIILKEALKAPKQTIMGNLGIKRIDDFGDDVLDPATVVKNSLTNAISVASTVLSTENVITKK